MNAIFSDFTIEYKGETYSSKMTMETINKIESQGVNIFQLASMIDEGGIPPLSLIATMYAVVLRSCGCMTTPNDVWVEINSGDAANVVISAKELLGGMFPRIEEPKGKKAE